MGYRENLWIQIESVRLEFCKQVREETFNNYTYDFLMKEIYKLVDEVKSIKTTFKSFWFKYKCKSNLQRTAIEMHDYYTRLNKHK